MSATIQSENEPKTRRDLLPRRRASAWTELGVTATRRASEAEGTGGKAAALRWQTPCRAGAGAGTRLVSAEGRGQPFRRGPGRLLSKAIRAATPPPGTALRHSPTEMKTSVHTAAQTRVPAQLYV